jgi:tRNA (guanine-N7-)-methyltransferase
MRVRAHVNPLSVRLEHSFQGFENQNPILIDVGACKGEFSEALMQKFPDRNFVLFEIRVPLADQLREKFKGRSNVIVFDGDAGKNFENILRSSVEKGVLIEEIFVNFPDPWFKEKHKKRRFINPDFLEKCSEWISDKTWFVFQTDQRFLFEETVETVEASPFSHIERFNFSAHGIPTHWEQQKLNEGSEIWRMQFKKK